AVADQLLRLGDRLADHTPQLSQDGPRRRGRLRNVGVYPAYGPLHAALLAGRVSRKPTHVAASITPVMASSQMVTLLANVCSEHTARPKCCRPSSPSAP